MTGAEFKKIVEYYGEDKVLSIGFDNSASTTIFRSSQPFSFKEYFNEELECLEFIQFDSKGFPYHVVKHVENIQSIIFRNTGFSLDQYDGFSIRG